MPFVIVRSSFIFFFFFNDTATTEIYTLSLHDALPISHADFGAELQQPPDVGAGYPRELDVAHQADRSEEHTSELQSLAYLVCRLLLEKKKKKKHTPAEDHITAQCYPPIFSLHLIVLSN